MFVWQNTPLDFDLVNNYFSDIGIKLTQYKTYFALPHRCIKLADRCFLYTGIINCSDIEQWIGSLDIHDLDTLHNQLQNIDGQYSFCLITANTVTIGRDLFATKPIGYMISDNTLCVSSSPGVVNKLHHCHMVTPNNSLWTFSTTGKLIQKSSAYTIDYDSTCTESEWKDTAQKVAEKVAKHNVCGIALSSGKDSGMIDSICINNQVDIGAIATAIGDEDKDIIKARFEYRATHNQKVPHSFISKATPKNSQSIIDSVEKYLGYSELINKDHIIGAYQVAKFLAKYDCNVAFIGMGIRYMYSPFFYTLPQENYRNFIFPDDMRLIFETSQPILHTANFENWTIDCVPYLLCGIESYLYYSDWDLVHSWIRLPANIKNLHRKEQELVYKVDLQFSIMDKFQYPYHTNNKVGGPIV
jgi:hypothetical protein